MKKLKSLIALGLVATTLLSFTGCVKSFNATDKKTFESALEDVIDLDDDEYSSQKGKNLYGVDGCTRDIWYYGDDMVVEFREFDDEEDAHDYFEDIYDSFDKDTDRDRFVGNHSMKISATSGYIIVNGEGDDAKSFVGDDDIYGGVYFAGTTVVNVYVRSDKDKDHKKIDEFLDAIGYPNP